MRTDTKLAPCQPGILFNNWLGPPECKPQPALKEVSVIGWISLGGNTGRIVQVSAAQESPPGSLSISHMLALAEASVEGRLY